MEAALSFHHYFQLCEVDKKIKTNWQFSVFTEDSYRPIEHFLFSNTFCDRKNEGFKILLFDTIISLEQVAILPRSLTNWHNDIFIIFDEI